MYSSQLHWRLPRRPHLVTLAAFSPSYDRSTLLVVGYSDNTFQLFDADACTLHAWSLANPVSHFPLALTSRPSPLECVFFHPRHCDRLGFRGKGFAAFVDLSRPLPREPRVIGFSSITPTAPAVANKGSIYMPPLPAGTLLDLQSVKRKNKGTPAPAVGAVGGGSVGDGTGGLVVVERYRGVVHMTYVDCGEHAPSKLVSRYTLACYYICF